MIVNVLFYVFGAILVLTALGVITARNPVHCALFLVLAFLNSAVIWLLLEAEFLAIDAGRGLCRRGDGAVAVRGDDARRRRREAAAGLYALCPAGRAVALIVVAQIGLVVYVRKLGPGRHGRGGRRPAGGLFEHAGARAPALHAVPVPVRDRGRHPAGRDRRGHHAHHARPPGTEGPGHRQAGRGAARRTACASSRWTRRRRQ